jgi:hypothetical protein
MEKSSGKVTVNDLRLAYAQNRAEEQPKDIWEEFIIPLFYLDLPIRKQRKSIVFQGGRGCGKTTLLRYLSHTTQFSSRRKDLSAIDTEYVGLYLRADTNYLASMEGGGIDEAIWQRAFNHWLACSLTLELLDSLTSINSTEARLDTFGGLENLDFSEIAVVYEHLPTGFVEFKSAIQRERNKLTVWINNLDAVDRPLLLPGREFLRLVVDQVRTTLPYLKDSVFAVFIDEYENLNAYQRHMVNELMKHGESPLLFNIAVKRNALVDPMTRGPESIQNIGDLRTIDIEDHLAKDFDLFAAELLFFRIAENVPELRGQTPISMAQLRDPEQVAHRKTDVAYRGRLLAAANGVFPRLSELQLAEGVLADETLRRHLKSNIQRGLRHWGSKLDAEEFLVATHPEASLVCGALLNRRSEKPESILEEFRKHIAGHANRFDSSEWIKNNLVGVTLQLYSRVNRACPLFAGFDTIVLMSRGNVRHFLEMLHQAFLKLEGDQFIIPSLSVEDQADAVRAASLEFLTGVRSSGTFGNYLHALALSLGAIFREKQRDVAQSEPEINHFSIGDGDIGEKLKTYLAEAVKWSVLYELEETKKKSIGVKSFEYVLNPIFSGYFQISYRKKRSIPISADDLLTLLEKDVKQKDVVVRRIARVSDDPNLTFDFEDEL